MNKSLKRLLDLQEVDLRIAEKTRAIAAIDNGARFKTLLHTVQQQLVSNQAALQEIERQIRDGEMELKTIESKIKSQEDKAYSGKVTNFKELSGIEQEIAMFQRNKGKQEERILPLYDAAEALRTEIESARRMAEAASKKVDAIGAKFEQQSAELRTELTGLEQRRSKAAQKTEPRLLQRYEAVKPKVGGLVVVPVKDGRCGGCNMALSSFLLRELPDESRMRTCETCSRFIYSEE